MENELGEIRIQSFNPYAARFQNRNVISREALHLIKYLRSQGYKVTIEPENNNEINFLTEKGIREFLLDPINIILINIPISIIVSLIASYIYDCLKRKPKNDEVNIFLEIDEKGNKIRYSHSGQPISDRRFKDLLKILERKAKAYKSSQKKVPPDPNKPFPIFLEHTEKLIGWGQIYEDKTGLKVEDAEISDSETLKRIRSGELKGMSIGGLVRKSKCSVCGLNYLDCNHVTGKIYDGVKCICDIYEVDLAEISVVKYPINPQAKIKEKNDV